MAELLEIYDLEGKILRVAERETFYSDIKEEFANTGKITEQVKSIRLLLLNSKGRIFLQKRSKFKGENPGLYDKTVGGHVPKGYSWEMSVIKESSEELGFPATVVADEEFDEAIDSTDLSIIGLFRKVDYISNFKSNRTTLEGNEFLQPFMTTFYIGYYDGSIKFVDGESSGLEVFSLEELQDELKQNPDKFTEDIKFMIERYEKYLVPITRQK